MKSVGFLPVLLTLSGYMLLVDSPFEFLVQRGFDRNPGIIKTGRIFGRSDSMNSSAIGTTVPLKPKTLRKTKEVSEDKSMAP